MEERGESIKEQKLINKREGKMLTCFNAKITSNASCTRLFKGHSVRTSLSYGKLEGPARTMKTCPPACPTPFTYGSVETCVKNHFDYSIKSHVDVMRSV